MHFPSERAVARILVIMGVKRLTDGGQNTTLGIFRPKSA
jgi:hypothetical protein